MSQFRKNIEARQFIARNRPALLWVSCVCMAGVAIADELVAHDYLSAANAPVVFLVIVPWLGWRWFKPTD